MVTLTAAKASSRDTNDKQATKAASAARITKLVCDPTTVPCTSRWFFYFFWNYFAVYKSLKSISMKFLMDACSWQASTAAFLSG
jgi:hypothetical protein